MGFKKMQVYALMMVMLCVPCHCVNCPPHPPGGSDIVDFKLQNGYWHQIDVRNMRTEQIGTYLTDESRLAVDGNPNTAAVACNPCDHTLSVGPGWWKIYLDRIYLIAGVRLQSSAREYDADYLQDIEVHVTYGDTDCCPCGRYRTDSKIARLSKVTVVCHQPLFGNQVKVSRPRHAKFRPDALAIAEIEILSSNLFKLCK